ncbi:MAG: GIY-YIG nuclease family protein [Ignavibacteria bacterium]
MEDKKYYTYILYSGRTNRYYVGHTNDLERRMKYHNYQKIFQAN